MITAGNGKSHMLVALGIAAVEHGHKVRYFTAADPVETLYRGPADNSVGKVIDTLLRNDLVTDGDSYRTKQARARGGNPDQDQLIKREEWGLSVGHQRGPRTGR